MLLKLRVCGSWPGRRASSIILPLPTNQNWFCSSEVTLLESETGQVGGSRHARLTTQTGGQRLQAVLLIKLDSRMAQGLH